MKYLCDFRFDLIVHIFFGAPPTLFSTIIILFVDDHLYIIVRFFPYYIKPHSYF